MRVPLKITGLLAGRCTHSNVFSQAGLMDDGLCVSFASLLDAQEMFRIIGHTLGTTVVRCRMCFGCSRPTMRWGVCFARAFVERDR